ncbi:disulfide bond formation protein B [Endozoicomonas sp. SM1973]|uniref:Disulfide bond formation protein B n=1 Tax=Spartinivicinus marinus TaxID=2994442 RepID=A0A853I729_9GAMM|nr:disulfide bond formation protein B [Spartinivicinus marinus]MCX4027110.1 disulfide bond formation protein B [Spartinivicinus marinus]NYZ68589.1 disulfide bond formation protein B [Spartinivicinus marinus]
MTLPKSRLLFLLALAVCLALLGGALYMQHGLGLEPCPMCIMQRIVFMAIALVCLIAVLHGPENKGYRIYGGIALLFSGFGVALASRQLWLQSLPADQVPECMPSVEYMIDVLPFTEVLGHMLTGTGDCAKVVWEFLGLSIPGWTLVAFICFTLFSLVEVFRQRGPRTLFS